MPAALPHFKHAAGPTPPSGPPSVYLRADLGQEDVWTSGLARRLAGEPQPGSAGRPEIVPGLRLLIDQGVMAMKIIGYLRMSSKNKDDHEDSIAEQKRKILAWAR